MKKYLVIPGIAAALIGSAALVASTRPITIMPVGDSITEGDAIDGSYRNVLHDLLVAGGIGFDFVGSAQLGPDSDHDNDHEGYSGWTIDEMREYIAAPVALYRPDVVLLIIGTNDLWSFDLADSQVSRLELLLQTLRTASATTRILVGSIPPVEYSEIGERVEEYNAKARIMVERLQDAMIRYADVCSLMTVEQLSDGVHPNMQGNQTIARGWLRALSAVYGWGAVANGDRRYFSALYSNRSGFAKTAASHDLLGRTVPPGKPVARLKITGSSQSF